MDQNFFIPGNLYICENSNGKDYPSRRQVFDLEILTLEDVTSKFNSLPRICVINKIPFLVLSFHKPKHYTSASTWLKIIQGNRIGILPIWEQDFNINEKLLDYNPNNRNSWTLKFSHWKP